jgi:2-methylisocitrate lyase-like PEP mutase family enzyme
MPTSKAASRRMRAGVAASVHLAVETGVAGLSIEDSTGDAARAAP